MRMKVDHVLDHWSTAYNYTNDTLDILKHVPGALCQLKAHVMYCIHLAEQCSLFQSFSLTHTVPKHALTHSLPHTVPTHALSPSLTHCSNMCSLPPSQTSYQHVHSPSLTQTLYQHVHSPSLTQTLYQHLHSLPHSHTV